jgi:hypothetical protein
MRTLPKLGEKIVEQIESAWVEAQPDWARKRLLRGRRKNWDRERGRSHIFTYLDEKTGKEWGWMLLR